MENQTCQFPRQSQQGFVYPIALCRFEPFSQVLHGHTVRPHRPVVPAQLLANKAKRKVQEMSGIPALMMPFPSVGMASRNPGLLLPCIKAHLLSANTSWFMRAEVESKPFLFVYTTNQQFDFWPFTKFCCFYCLRPTQNKMSTEKLLFIAKQELPPKTFCWIKQPVHYFLLHSYSLCISTALLDGSSGIKE